MRNTIQKFFSRTDWVMLALCLAASIFGIIMISSATNLAGSSSYVRTQIVSLVLGLILFVIISYLDMEILGEHQLIMTIFAAIFLMLLYPFGVAGQTGNRSWMKIPGIPFMIQPAEYCKIVYILVVARIMTIYREHINSLACVLRLGIVSLLFVGLIIVISSDAGVALIYVFAFIIMAITGGFHIIWFILGGASLAVVISIAWTSGIIRDDQKDRIMVIFDSSIDPNGLGVRWQAKRSLNAITGGGLTGQGLYQGTQTQAENIPAQHTDFIFAVIGEELGYLGCILCIALLVAIAIRIVYIGVRSESYFYRQLCIGISAVFMFQIIVNIGMCLGLTPVIGLTLPFISYGGSSQLSLYIAMGVISSVRLHPSPDSQQRYLTLPI